MQRPTFYITDVFTTRRYGGNQLATLIDCEALSADEMLAIAREINFAETTFITSREPRDGGYDVRIFTPGGEVEFAGHPTLGTAHVLRNHILPIREREIRLNLPVGQVPVTFVEEGGTTVVWMKQPAPRFGALLGADRVAAVLGLDPVDVAADWPVEEVSTGFPTLVVPVRGLEALQRVTIDAPRYFDLVREAWAKLILIFAPQGYEADQAFSVRVFGDYFGVPEDAATGSANGCLAAYLARRRYFGSGEIDVTVGQGYGMGRPSRLLLRATDTGAEIDVRVGGGVVDVAQGVWG